MFYVLQRQKNNLVLTLNSQFFYRVCLQTNQWLFPYGLLYGICQEVQVQQLHCNIYQNCQRDANMVSFIHLKCKCSYQMFRWAFGSLGLFSKLPLRNLYDSSLQSLYVYNLGLNLTAILKYIPLYKQIDLNLRRKRNPYLKIYDYRYGAEIVKQLKMISYYFQFSIISDAFRYAISKGVINIINCLERIQIINNLQIKKRIDCMQRKNHHQKQIRQTEYSYFDRTFNSPKHYPQVTDYNTYMKIQKIQKQQSKQPTQQISNKNTAKQAINKKSKSPHYSSVMVTQLVKQNDFLLDQVIKYKQTVSKYQKTVNRLKRSKSQKCATTTLSSQDNIAIMDYQNFNQLNLNFVQSKLVTQRISKNSKNQGQKWKKQSRCKQLLEQSLIYIKHSRNSISYDIQQLNDKLCRLIQLGATQTNKEKKTYIRLQIADCVKQLKQLRRQYQQLYC